MPDLRLIDRAQIAIGRIVSYGFLATVVVITYEVVARYAFNAPTIWAHELTVALTAVGFLLGGPYALVLGHHIRITSLYMHFPPAMRRAADVVSCVVTLAYIAGMIYAGWIVAARAWRSMETSASAWNQPTPVVIKTVLVVASVLIALQTVLQLLRVSGLISEPGEPES